MIIYINIIRALSATLFLSQALTVGSAQDQASLADSLLGTYERERMENDWHKVTVEPGSGSKLLWKNAAGQVWPLEIRDGSELWSTEDCPYGVQRLAFERDKEGKFTGLQFNDESYRLVASRSSARAAKDFWKEAVASWRAGPIRALDEEEVEGTIQTYDSAALVKLMFAEKREMGEYGYAITHRLIGAPNILEAVHEVRWETISDDGDGPPSFLLTEVFYDLRTSPVRKYFKERKMKQHFFNLKSKPESVEGSFATKELDPGAIATLKEENGHWWAGGMK